MDFSKTPEWFYCQCWVVFLEKDGIGTVFIANAGVGMRFLENIGAGTVFIVNAGMPPCSAHRFLNPLIFPAIIMSTTATNGQRSAAGKKGFHHREEKKLDLQKALRALAGMEQDLRKGHLEHLQMQLHRCVRILLGQERRIARPDLVKVYVEMLDKAARGDTVAQTLVDIVQQTSGQRK